MQTDIELKYQRENTLAFIQANSTTIQLIPAVVTKDGAGIRRTPGTPRPPQAFRLIDQSDRKPSPGVVRTLDGQDRIIEYILLAPYDAEIALYDFWQDGGTTYEVVQIFPANNYEIRAAVVSR